MASIFDRETLLDLTVNVIPLGIILFFVGLFVLTDPFPGLSRLGYLITLGLHVVPFVALAVLTYVSGKAIAGDEERSSVFFQGQATLDNAPTREEARSSFDRHVSQEEREDEPAEETVESDEDATAEQEEEPAHTAEDVAEEAQKEAPDESGTEAEQTVSESDDREADSKPTETLDEQMDAASGGGDPDESAAEKGERAAGTVSDEADQSNEASERAEAGETGGNEDGGERAGSDGTEGDGSEGVEGSDQTDETATGDGETAPTERDENAAAEDDETGDDSRAE